MNCFQLDTRAGVKCAIKYILANMSVAGTGDTLPSQTGNAGLFLQTNGSTTLWATPAGGGGAAAAGTLTGATLASNVLASSLTSVGTLATLTVTAPIVGSVTGNAATATTLATSRTINGTSFNGSANITVTAAAGTLTGSTLNSTVTASSLTSVGVLAALTVTATITGSVSGNAGTATKLATARDIAITGDIAWSVSFDGSANVTAAGTLSATGVAAGTYNSVTVDSKGRVTAATNTSSVLTTAGDLYYRDGTGPQRLAIGTNGQRLKVVSSLPAWATEVGIFGIDIAMSDGSVITTGIKGKIVMPVAGTITSITLLSDVTGSCVLDIWKDSYANYPPTIADTITASAKPTISASNKSTDSTLTGWSKSFVAGDIFYVNVDSNSSITQLKLAVNYNKL